MADNALTKLLEIRSTFGAQQNRLEHIYNFNGISLENQMSSESRIHDVDYASEMTEYTKQQIITQASQTMLSQANIQSQSILQLLS